MTLPSIVELIPHRPPMLLLDHVLSFDANRVVCGACPTLACIFARGGVVPAVVALEYMAQATAACLALGRPHAAGARAPGLLVAARRLSLACAEIALGTELRIVASLTATAGAAASFDCSVEASGTNLASAELTVYLASAAS